MIPAAGPRHALVLPREERGRRILWRTVAIGLFAALEAGGILLAQHWNLPGGLAIPVVAVPYWAAATAIWSRWGPEMPGSP